MGYTPSVVAQHIVDHLSSILRSADLSAVDDTRPVVAHSGADFLIPTMGLSIKDFAEYLRDILSLERSVVRGEILVAENSTRLTLRLRLNGERIGDQRSFGNANLDVLVKAGSIAILREIDPNALANYYYNMTMSLAPGAEKIEEYQQKISELEEIIYRQDNDCEKKARISRTLAVVLKYVGNHKEAILKYKEVLHLKCARSSAYNNWGVVLSEQQDYGCAVRAFRRAIEIDGSYAAAHANLGDALSQLGHVTAAVKHYDDAIRLEPQYSWVYRNWANTLARAGDHASAVTRFETATTLNPQFVRAYVEWGIVLAHLGDYQGAIDLYKKAENISGRYVALYNNWGEALANLGDHEGAKDKFEKAVERGEEVGRAYVNLAEYYGGEKNLREAIVMYRKAISDDPKYFWTFRGRSSDRCELPIQPANDAYPGGVDRGRIRSKSLR